MKTTFEELMEDPERKKRFDKEYNQFLLSEFLLDAMRERKMSENKLAKISGIPLNVINDIKETKHISLTLDTVSSLLGSLGYELIARNKRHSVRICV